MDEAFLHVRAIAAARSDVIISASASMKAAFTHAFFSAADIRLIRIFAVLDNFTSNTS